MQHKTFIFLGLIVFSHIVIASHNYDLKGFPRQGSCRETVSYIQTQFEQATHLSVSQAYCLAETAKTFDVRLEYESETVAPLVSTESSQAGYFGVGRFKTKEICKQKLSGEVELFERATELKTVFAYCTQDPVFTSGDTWFPRVDAFGVAKLSPRASIFPITAQPVGISKSNFEAYFAKVLEEEGNIFSTLSFHSQGILAEGRVFYYGLEPLRFTNKDYSRTLTTKDCEIQISQVTAAVDSFDLPSMLVYCSRYALGGNQWELTILNKGEELKTIETSLQYKTAAECEARREGVVKHYQEEMLMDRVIVGLCTYRNRAFTIDLIERHK